MLVEATILRCDDRLAQVLRDLGERHVGSVLLAVDPCEDVPVAIVDQARLFAPSDLACRRIGTRRAARDQEHAGEECDGQPPRGRAHARRDSA